MNKRSTKRTDFGARWLFVGLDCRRCGARFKIRTDFSLIWYWCYRCVAAKILSTRVAAGLTP